ncbi:hypothetical protein ACOME3_004674 [Neoechinorhynchus agilis]
MYDCSIQLLFLFHICNPGAYINLLNDFLASTSDAILTSTSMVIVSLIKPRLLSLYGRELFKANVVGDILSSKFWSSLYWPSRARFQLDQKRRKVRSMSLYCSA